MTFAGHEEAWRAWRDALGGERMHHAWLLAGKKGLGKSAFAMDAARQLVAEPGVPQPAAGPHPDILLLTNLPATAEDEKARDEGKPYQVKRSIAIAQIREMQHRLVTRPTLGSRRAIIIDPADDLEKSAANALLKSLEEPPSGTFFFLVAHRPGRLLRFPALDESQMAAVLAAKAPGADAASCRAAMAAASGSPGAALDFIAHDLGPIHDLMLRISAEGDPRFSLRGALAEAIGARPDRERVLATLDLARAVLAERMAQTARSGLPALIAAHDELSRLFGQAPTYNFDPGLLVMEIGGLLASAAAPRERANG